MVAEAPKARESKLAWAARSQGYDVVLLYRNAPNYSLSAYFSEARQFRDEWHALELAAAYSPQAYHVFAANADPTAENMVRYKPGRVIFEFTDMVQGMVNTEWSPLHHKPQRYCTENADGVVARDLQLQFARKRLNYSLSGPVLYFPDYCWDRAPLALKASPGKRFNVVVAGNFGLEKRGAADWGYLEVARTFARHGVQFHIYPYFGWFGSPKAEFQDAFSDYMALEKETGLVHLHDPLEADKVGVELQQYDFGINVIWGLVAGRSIKSHTMIHLALCGSSRNADYLDAGLPVIISPELRFQRSLLGRYSMAVDAVPDFFRDPIRWLASGSRLATEQAGRARHEFALSRHASRLANFYGSL